MFRLLYFLLIVSITIGGILSYEDKIDKSSSYPPGLFYYCDPSRPTYCFWVGRPGADQTIPPTTSFNQPPSFNGNQYIPQLPSINLGGFDTLSLVRELLKQLIDQILLSKGWTHSVVETYSPPTSEGSTFTIGASGTSTSFTSSGSSFSSSSLGSSSSSRSGGEGSTPAFQTTPVNGRVPVQYQASITGFIGGTSPSIQDSSPPAIQSRFYPSQLFPPQEIDTDSEFDDFEKSLPPSQIWQGPGNGDEHQSSLSTESDQPSSLSTESDQPSSLSTESDQPIDNETFGGQLLGNLIDN
ncbi:hypothetical protein PPL_03969 [Heterostelium album PN500]|uniref:Uncharacterized protein n=1 Tax=Heterostelium pallidum (strain ATCC 26659 / Pp 5 / PN500) TaxID=670386 RepID=D3B5N1_HETP5|nr:hypothetical protein PPL_03969 [Heterostelium album PN500]EFA83179.1 hypothetical protein PPL_03969 [Heterostelium album PN500]|eukprot:XP_020435296.1 hypothetical protein PPL_03969 [Heterostelium album PN500]